VISNGVQIEPSLRGRLSRDCRRSHEVDPRRAHAAATASNLVIGPGMRCLLRDPDVHLLGFTASRGRRTAGGHGEAAGTAALGCQLTSATGPAA